MKQDKIRHNHGKILNIYTVYEISKICKISDYPTLENCLFTAVSLAKNADIDRYRYSGCGVGLDRYWSFSFPSTGFGRNVIMFGVDMISSTKIDNRKKETLILRKDPTKGPEHTLSTEKMYSIKFPE